MLEEIALKLFGDFTSPYLGYFDTLSLDLKKAGITQTLHGYLSTLIMITLLTFIISIISSSVFITMLVAELPKNEMPAIYAYTLGIIISIVVSAAVFFVGYYYPNIKGKGLEAQIDRSLPFAVSYMATSAASGMNPVDLFKVVSKRGGIIGNEASRIYTNVRSLGMSLPDAMQRSANTTPSRRFSDLLWGMTSIIKSGGDLEVYLRNRTKTFMTQYRRMLQDYANSVTFYTEIYITLVIVGSLFFIVLTSILSPLAGGGGGLLMLQTFLVFIFIPFVSSGFVVLLKGISPTE